MRHPAVLPVLASLAGSALLCAAAPARAGGQHDPNLTATIFLHGLRIGNALEGGVYGQDEDEPILDELSAILGLSSTNEGGDPPAPDVLAATTYYGDTPPPYYTPQDVADVAAATAQWGGGVPRYAVIVAKYAQNLMQRSGAQQVNVVSASFGSLVTRWMIEQDVEGLASSGKIARWLSLEGVVCGNWAVSREELDDLWEVLGVAAIDLVHMRYGWIEENLHAPRAEADNPLLAQILLGQTASTDDGAIDGALTAAMLVYGEFQPNDGVQGLFDAFYETVTPQSRFFGQTPAGALHHVTHLDLEEHPPAFVQAGAFLTQRRRVTITLSRAQVHDIHEPDFILFDFTPAEIVFESRVFSPLAADRWALAGPLISRGRDGASSPIVLYEHDNDQQFPDLVLFDNFVFEDETALDLQLGAQELDWDVRYGVFEPLGDDAQSLAPVNLTVPVTGPSTVTFSGADFSGDLVVDVTQYPFPLPGPAGDADGDGLVGIGDLLAVLAAWGPCPAPPADCPADLDGDGEVGILDLLLVIGHWGEG